MPDITLNNNQTAENETWKIFIILDRFIYKKIYYFPNDYVHNGQYITGKFSLSAKMHWLTLILFDISGAFSSS